MKLLAFLFILTTFLLFDNGEGITCHVCDSRQQAQCLDPFGDFKENGELVYPDLYLNDCDSMETRRQQGIPDGKSALGCKKIVETAYGETNTTRGCSWEDHTIGRSEENAHLVPCYKSGGIITGEMKNHYTFVCVCEDDNCNGSSALKSGTLTMFLFSLILIWLFRE